MTEQQIQTKKIKSLEADGYFVIKLIKTNKNGIPDVLALHPDYGIEFYEIKTKKGKGVQASGVPHERTKRIWIYRRGLQGMTTFMKWKKNF
jgi:hypothetical protein